MGLNPRTAGVGLHCFLLLPESPPPTMLAQNLATAPTSNKTNG